ncbi:MAG: TlpA family protein disulfide reductase [Bacteroidetes bacterium]|nr:MAG: TlpA family protein disulfide reductase [Bacteroidota bacterium]
MRLLTILIFLSVSAVAQQIKLVDVAWIEQMKANQSDTIYVINFWATWCKPCVAELPVFEKLGAEYAESNVKVLLVSTDMRKELNARLKSFVTEKQLKQQVLLMNEVNADKWINQVNADWSGAIPATWIIRGKTGFANFVEGEMNEEELRAILEKAKHNNIK